MKNKTLKELVANSVERYSNNIAFNVFKREGVTYTQVGERIAKVQEQLLSAGLMPGDKVALLSSNKPNWGVSYFAISTAGMVVVPILPDFSEEELEMIISHSESKALIVSDKLFTKISKETIERLNIVIRVNSLTTISQSVNTMGEIGEPKPDDLAAIIYTSGTTSKPKGVMLTHKALCSQIEIDYTMYPITEQDAFLSVLPLSHTFECTLGMIFPFSYGANVTYLDRPPTASVLMPALRGVRPTIMLIVPLLIEKIYRSQVAAKFNSSALWRKLSSINFTRKHLHKVAAKKLIKAFGGRIQFLGIGGAKLDIATERFLNEGGFPYAIGYGLTETAPVIAGAIPSQVRLGSTGPAAPNVRLRLENINPETGQGEVVALTPSVMTGYFKNPEATADVFTEDGWFRTGDLGEFDKDGWLYIKGRLKNMILGPSGENIYPEEIESVINAHAFISDSVVTEQDGRLVALVYFDTEALQARLDDWRDEWSQKRGEWTSKRDVLLKEVKDYVNKKVNRFSRIAEVVEEEQGFEKTPTHKIRRFLYNGKPKAKN